MRCKASRHPPATETSEDATMSHISRLFSYVLLLAAAVMATWGVLGFIEFFTDKALLMPLQNPNFPSGTQFIHWFLITASGTTLLIGYFSRWKHTPNVMVVLFACLATMCFIQTFDFMVREDRYSSYVREVIYYTIFSVYLFRSQRMKEHFQRKG